MGQQDFSNVKQTMTDGLFQQIFTRQRIVHRSAVKTLVAVFRQILL